MSAAKGANPIGAPESPKVLGGKLPRIDGPLKVSGRAVYTSDISLHGMLYAVPVRSTIAGGRITSIDASAAKKLPGVKAVYYRGNIRAFFRTAPPKGFTGLIDEKRPPFEDDEVRYYGQYVAVAVAQTMEQAKAAADAVRVNYTTAAHNVAPQLVADKPMKVESQRGDADAAFASAAVKVDQAYVTPTEVHNPIELHATVAAWDKDHVTLSRRRRPCSTTATYSTRCSACRWRTSASSRISWGRGSAASCGRGHTRSSRRASRVRSARR